MCRYNTQVAQFDKRKWVQPTPESSRMYAAYVTYNQAIARRILNNEAPNMVEQEHVHVHVYITTL